MKKSVSVLAMLLLFCMLLGSCGKDVPPEQTDPVTEAPATEAPETAAPETTVPETAAPETEPEPEPLTASTDGKKAIFIGNSMIYYGGVVTKGAYRQNDTGWFYQICRANGEKCTVTDCTYGNHSLSDFTAAGCKTSGCDVGIGGDLLTGLDLNSYDYVFMSEAGNNNANILRDVKAVMARFPNPDTVFIYMCHAYSYDKSHSNITSNLGKMTDLGIVIVDWGHLVFDVYKGRMKIKNTGLKYNKDTFVNHTSSDTHHPNPLSGYIAAQMCYCAVTGKTAVGQDYSKYRTLNYGAGKSFAAYKSSYYTAGTSNFDEVFASAADMEALQTLMDAYLGKWKAGVGYPVPKPLPLCEHEFDDGVIRTEPTELIPGLKVYTCKKCGVTKEEALPMLEKKKTNVALGAEARMYSDAKTSIGTASVFTDGDIGNNASTKADGAYAAKGSADSFGGNGIADGTKKVTVNAADGGQYEYWYAVSVDLGAGKSVNEIRVYAQGYKTTVLDHGIDLLISADGNEWTRVYSADRAELFSGTDDGKGWENYVDSTDAAATDAAPAYLTAEFAEKINIRYVMYGCTGYRDINGYYTTRFTEIEVFGNQ